MQFPLLRIFALALAISWGLTACAASTKIVNQWVNPDLASPRFRKIMVIGVSKQPSIRRTFEDEFVTQLKAAGVEAVPSYLYISEDGQVEESRLQAAVKQANADAVIITRLVRVEKKTEVSPGFYQPVPGLATAFIMAIPQPGSVITNPRESISTMCIYRRPICTIWLRTSWCGPARWRPLRRTISTKRSNVMWIP
jgi:hypothetical protein